MARMRSITEAMAHIKKADPSTNLTIHRLRVMIRTGEIKSFRAGKNFLVYLDDIDAFFSNLPAPETPASMATERNDIRIVSI